MKTLTEFSAFHLREAHSKAKEIHNALQTDGRPADELAAAESETLAAFLTERFKVEGEKLQLFLKAMELASAKPRELENLKRVVVYTIAEGEKVPGNFVKTETHALGAEYLPSLRPQKQDRREAGSKFSKEKGKGRGKRRGDMKGKRPDGSPERRGANARDGEGGGGAGGGRGPRRDAAGAPGQRPEGGNGGRGPRRDGAPGAPGGQRRDQNRGPRHDQSSGPRAPRKDLPPGHLSVEQAARAMKSTGIRPVEKPASAPTPNTSESNT